MIIRKDIDLNTPLTAEQAEMLEALADRPVTPGHDMETTLDYERRVNPYMRQGSAR